MFCAHTISLSWKCKETKAIYYTRGSAHHKCNSEYSTYHSSFFFFFFCTLFPVPFLYCSFVFCKIISFPFVFAIVRRRQPDALHAPLTSQNCSIQPLCSAPPHPTSPAGGHTGKQINSFDAVVHQEESPLHKRFLEECSLLLMRPAQHLTTLRAWCKAICA